jgi:phosphatidylglycerophosphate synthase
MWYLDIHLDFIDLLQNFNVLAAAVFVDLHIILDCLDGSVARLHHQTSKSGAFLDLFCDCITFILIPL